MMIEPTRSLYKHFKPSYEPRLAPCKSFGADDSFGHPWPTVTWRMECDGAERKTYSRGAQKVIRDSVCSHYATRNVFPQFPLSHRKIP